MENGEWRMEKGEEKKGERRRKEKLVPCRTPLCQAFPCRAAPISRISSCISILIDLDPFPSSIHIQSRQPPIPVQIHRKDSIRDNRSSILHKPHFRMTLRESPLPSRHAIAKPSRNRRAQFPSPQHATASKAFKDGLGWPTPSRVFSRVATDVHAQLLHALVLNGSDAHFQLCNGPHELQIAHVVAVGDLSLILIYRFQRFD